MECTNCGETMENDAQYCPKCGKKILEGEESCKEITTELNMSEVQKIKMNNKSARGKKKICNVLSIICCVLTIILGIGSSLIFLVRSATSEEAVDNLVDAKILSDIKIGFLLEDADKKQTISDYIMENLDDEFIVNFNLSKDDVKEFLNEKCVRTFVKNKLNDYIEDLFMETGDGIVESDEIKELLEDSAKSFYEDFGYYLSESDCEYISELIEKEGILKNTELTIYRVYAY